MTVPDTLPFCARATPCTASRIAKEKALIFAITSILR
jgi:hypothetical protein